jgi:hypothetical protein
MAIIDEILQRLDNFTFNRRRRLEQVFGQSQREVIHFKNEKAVPLFGASPDGFALDWVTYRQPQTRYVPTQPIQRVNTHGYIKSGEGLRPPEKSELEGGKRLTYSGTDQRPTSFGHDVSTSDKAIELHHEPKKTLESSRGHDVTEGDRQAADLRKYPYDFSV